MKLKYCIFLTAILVPAAAFFTISADTLTVPLVEAGYGHLESIHLTKNGKYLITLSKPGKVYIWDIAKEKVIASVAPADTDWFVAADLLPGDTTLITGTCNRTIAQWRIPDGSFRSSFSLNSQSLRSIDTMVASPGGERIAVVQGKTLRMLSFSPTGTLRHMILYPSQTSLWNFYSHQVAKKLHIVTTLIG